MQYDSHMTHKCTGATKHANNSKTCTQGVQSSEALQEAGQHGAASLVQYESAPQPEIIQQGQEPQALLSALGGEASECWQPQECAAYDEDFQVNHVCA